MRLFVIFGLALAVAAQGLSKEERDAIRAQKAADRKANKAKNKKNKKKTTTTAPPTTTSTTTTSTTTTSTTTTSTTTTTTTTQKPTTTKATTKRTTTQKPLNSGRAVGNGATMCVTCNQKNLADCLNQEKKECPQGTYCALTMRTQNGAATQYEILCKQDKACISNKRVNGWAKNRKPNDQCNLTDTEASTCRQCCKGSDCLEFYANFAEKAFYDTRWNWNMPNLDAPYET